MLATVGFFRLGHLPGDLDKVPEHFRRNLFSTFFVKVRFTLEYQSVAYGNTKDIKDKQFSDVLPDQIARDNFSSVIVTGCLADEEERRVCSGVKH